MANTGLLTQGMTVEEAQILDNRLQTQRDAPFRQAPQNYGGGAMGGLLSASGQAVNSAALAGRNIGEFAGDAMTGRTGRGQENEIAARKEEQEIMNAMQGGEGNTLSEKLFSTADTLLASKNSQARAKGEEVRIAAQKAKVQEETLQLRKDTLTLQQETAEIRKIEAETSSEKKTAQNALEIKKNIAATTKQVLVQDSEGNKFTMITSETGLPTKYTPAGDVQEPVGLISTMTEVNSRAVTDRALNIEFQKVYLKDRTATAKKFGEVKKVFTNASKSFELLEEIEKTGGAVGGVVANFTREAKRYLGIQDSESVPIELLKKKLGMSIAGNLKETFGGSQITDSERTFLVANMLSIDDTPEVMKRKLKAIMEVTSKGLSKLKELSATKNYTNYTDLQNKYIQEDYLDVMEKFELQFDSSVTATNPTNSAKTADQLLAEEQIAKRKAEKPNRLAPRMGG